MDRIEVSRSRSASREPCRLNSFPIRIGAVLVFAPVVDSPQEPIVLPADGEDNLIEARTSARLGGDCLRLAATGVADDTARNAMSHEGCQVVRRQATPPPAPAN